MPGAALAIRHVRLHLRGIGIDGCAFALQIVPNRIAETRVRDGMGGPGERRLETSTHLVLALGARLEALDAALDAELDALVIARLEMQAVIVGLGSPVTAVERVLAPEEDG